MVAAVEVEEAAEDEVVVGSAVVVEVDPAVVFLAGRGRPLEVRLRMAVPREVDLRRLAHDLQFPRRGQEVPVDPLFRMRGPDRDQVLETAICARAHDLQFSPALDQALAPATGGPQTFQVQVSVLGKELALGRGLQIDQVRDKGIVLGSLSSPRGFQGLTQVCQIRERAFRIAWPISRIRSKNVALT